MFFLYVIYYGLSQFTHKFKTNSGKNDVFDQKNKINGTEQLIHSRDECHLFDIIRLNANVQTLPHTRDRTKSLINGIGNSTFSV